MALRIMGPSTPRPTRSHFDTKPGSWTLIRASPILETKTMSATMSLQATPRTFAKGIATTALLAALAAGASTLATPADAQNAWLDPAYGTIDVYRGFGSQSFDLQAGGQYHASSLGNNCAGYIANAPDYTINFQGRGRVPLELSAHSHADTTLVVSGPNGRVHCNDDSNGLNPALSIHNPQAGQYAVWVGTFQQDSSYPSATLTVSAGRGGHQPHPPLAFNAHANPAFGRISVTRGFGTQSFDLQAGGTVNAHAVNSSCNGYVADVPDYTINYQGRGRRPLELSAHSSADTTLVVVGPDGRAHCNDDSNGLNPALSIHNPQAGNYAVWVGTFSQNAGYPDASLTVSTRRGPNPGPQPRPRPDPHQSSFNASAQPTYGYVDVSGRFGSQSFDLQAGGTLRASSVVAQCEGFIADAPDYTIDYSGRGRRPLAFAAHSSADTTMVVVGPDGAIYCDDDTNGLNPALNIHNPQAGLYAVWIGTFSANNAYPNASLTVSTGRGTRPGQVQFH